MCLKLDAIIGYMHYYASLYETSNIDHWELINEAWIRLQRHNITNPKFASSSIRWSMQCHITKINKQRNRVNAEAKKYSLSTRLADGLTLVDVIGINTEKNIERIDLLASLLRKAKVKRRNLLLIKRRFVDNMSFSEIAEIENITREAVSQRLKYTLKKIRERMFEKEK